METETIAMPEPTATRARTTRSRASNRVNSPKTKRSDRLKSVIVRFRITPEQERNLLAEYPNLRISMLARRRLLGKRIGSPEHKQFALEMLDEIKESEQMLRALYAALDSEAASHPFGRLLARETQRIGGLRQKGYELFMML